MLKALNKFHKYEKSTSPIIHKITIKKVQTLNYVINYYIVIDYYINIIHYALLGVLNDHSPQLSSEIHSFFSLMTLK